MKNLTFCIQGTVVIDRYGQNLTQNLIRSIKLYYPNSPIIFSTWESEEVGNLEGVTLVKSKDPGSSFRFADSPEKNNINRQIVSTLGGLKATRTEFVVKMRSDLLIENRRLGEFVKNLPRTLNNPLTIFDKYVIVLDRLTFSPAKKNNFILHVTDMLQAGKTSDILKMWEIEKMTRNQEDFYLEASPKELNSVGRHIPEFRAEQFFWNQLIKKELGYGLKSTLDEYLEKSIEVEELFQLNIIPFRFPTLGISIQKETYEWSKKDSWISEIYAFTFSDWSRFARKAKLSKNFPKRLLFWEFRGQLYGFLYRKGFNFPPNSIAQRSR